MPTPPANSSNRRRQPRLRRRLDVALNLRGRMVGAQTQNLSATGLLIHSQQLLLAGTAVTGAMTLDGATVHFTALVKWARTASRSMDALLQNSMGLEFLDAPGRAYLEYLKRGLKDPNADIEPAPRTELARPIPQSPVVPQEVPAVPPPIPRAAVQPAAQLAPQRQAVASQEPTAVEQRPVRAVPLGRIVPRDEKATEVPFAKPAPQQPSGGPATEVTRVNNRFGLSPGLVGRVEANTRSSNQKLAGTSPLAISAAATLVERAAVQATASALPEGNQTQAISMSLQLVLPAYVTIGSKLEATALLADVGADRVLQFSVEVREGARLVATGEHKRLIGNP